MAWSAARSRRSGEWRWISAANSASERAGRIVGMGEHDRSLRDRTFHVILDGETAGLGRNLRGRAFHVETDGETTASDSGPTGPFEIGVLVGILVGEGHFGGDGRQPQVTLRMHVRHEALFLWLGAHFPGGRLYGPYHHGGRSYYQWM